ncbi:hypothetical protein, partial [Falsiroseomonas oryzae]|uniref:hypothetical protein n=1 Tax=Falsiroseomonas oryzae TaxID=2766473 RepID=UPI0022EB2973
MDVPRFPPAKAKLVLPPPGEAETGDGDTMRLSVPFRLVSVDTPEKRNFAGPPERSQKLLDAALLVLEGLERDGKVPRGFAAYFTPRVHDGGAKRHDAAAERATRALRSIRSQRLGRSGGKLRDLAVILAGEAVDSNGRMLAYVAPFLEKAERDRLGPEAKERRTFNLDLVAEGFAASFPVWPSFPSRREDFTGFLDAAEDAHRRALGSWGNGGAGTLLTGYEFRALVRIGRLAAEVKAGKRTARPSDYLAVFERHCVDRTGAECGRFGFVDVPHGARIWAWTKAAVPALAAWLAGAPVPAGAALP